MGKEYCWKHRTLDGRVSLLHYLLNNRSQITSSTYICCNAMYFSVSAVMSGINPLSGNVLHLHFPQSPAPLLPLSKRVCSVQIWKQILEGLYWKVLTRWISFSSASICEQMATKTNDYNNQWPVPACDVPQYRSHYLTAVRLTLNSRTINNFMIF